LQRPSVNVALPRSTTSTGLPKKGANRLHSMMEARPDWVLSRQRAWGVPLTCFNQKRRRCRRMNDFCCANPEVNQRRRPTRSEVDGADVWYEDNGAKEAVPGPGFREPWTKYTQVFDILACGSIPVQPMRFVLREPWKTASEAVIADVLYGGGTDQHRGRFQFSSACCNPVGTHGPRALPATSLTAGFTLDEKGHEMSKSSAKTPIVPNKRLSNSMAPIFWRLLGG